MTDMTPVPEAHPMLVAFREYKESDRYEYTREWAGNPDYVDGALLAAFSEGYIAASLDSAILPQPETEPKK